MTSVSCMSRPSELTDLTHLRHASHLFEQLEASTASSGSPVTTSPPHSLIILRPQLFRRPYPIRPLHRSCPLDPLHPKPTCTTMLQEYGGQTGRHAYDALSEEHGREFGRALTIRRDVHEVDSCKFNPSVQRWRITQCLSIGQALL